MISDTSKEAEQKQIELLRRMTSSERLQIGLDLTATSRALLEQGVRSRHPEYTEDEVRLAVNRLILPEPLFLKAYPQAAGIKS
jgi:hypothetical protein